MSAPVEFPTLLDRLREGRKSAAGVVYERFTGQLLALARQNLSDRLRTKLDPEDVVQSVYRIFFDQVTRSDLPLSNWNGLWGLLRRITLNKCRDQADHFQAARRDVRQEVGSPADLLTLLAADPSPSPAEAAELTDLVERWLGGLSEEDAEVAVLCLQGYSLPEVCVRVRRAHRSVRRMVARARERLLGLLNAEAERPPRAPAGLGGVR